MIFQKSGEDGPNCGYLIQNYEDSGRALAGHYCGHYALCDLSRRIYLSL